MALSLRDALLRLGAVDRKLQPLFKDSDAAYSAILNIYRKTRGVTPALRQSYDFYLKHTQDNNGQQSGSGSSSNPGTSRQDLS